MMNGITWAGIHSMTLGFLIPSLEASTSSSSPAIHDALISILLHWGEIYKPIQEVVTTQTAIEEARGAHYTQDGHDPHLFPRKLHWMHLSQ